MLTAEITIYGKDGDAVWRQIKVVPDVMSGLDYLYQPPLMVTHVGDSQSDEFLNLWVPVGGHCHGCSDWIAGRL